MKKTILLFIFLCCCICSFGQNAAQYIFSTSTGPYTQIVGGTSAGTIQVDDGTLTNIPIGFTFNFCGVNYTQVSTCSNGWLSLGNSTLTTFTNSFANVGGLVPVLMPFWEDLHGAAGTAWYQTTGTAPNRIFTFEWRNWDWFPASGTPKLSMQVKLFETSNVIHFIYRQEPSAPASISATIGIAKTAADYQTLNSATAAPTPSSTVFTETISSRPPTDQIYIWSPPLPCTGQPVAGIAGFSPGCPASVSLSGYTVATQLIFQWQKRDACATAWTNIPGANSYGYNIPGLSTTSDFRAYIVCINGGLSDTSNFVTVNPMAPCYCASGATTTGDEEILGVTVGSLVSPSTCGTTGGPGSLLNQYSDYTTVYPPLDLVKGATVPYTVQIGTCGGNFSSGTAIFIDYNIDGDFTDAGEQVYGTPATTNGPYTFSGSFVVPATAASGLTRMRVINAESFSGVSITPCLSYGFGETEDYALNIMYAPTVTGAGTFCSGATATLIATAPGISGQTEFFWKLPNNTYAAGDTLILPNAQVPQTGLYTAYVITYPCGGGVGDTSGPKAVNIWVNQTPGPPVVDAVITYCQFSVFDSIAIFGQNLKWYTVPVGGVANTTAPTVNTSVFSSATYYVSQTISGCESVRTPVTINVVPQAGVPGVISPVGYCQGDVPIPLQAMGQNIRWYSVATGGVGTPITPTPSTNAQGTFTWYATQTIDGCESARVPVVVNVSYRPNALILADRAYVCQYDTMSVFYFGNALPNADYVWTLPNGATIVTGSGQGPLVIRFDTAGIQRVVLVVDNQGCVGPLAYLDIPVKLAPVVQIDMQEDGCQGDVINLAISYSTPGVDFYTWDFAGGSVVYGAVTVGPYGIRWDSPGDKVVTTIATDDLCKSLPETDTIRIHGLPDAHILTPGQICSGDSVKLQASVISPNYTYQWQPQQFFGEAHEPVQWAVVDFPREIFLTVTSEFNCRSTDSMLINASPCCEVYFPSAFSPNADGRNDVFRMLTIRSGHTEHETGHHQITTLRIHNRWGQKVFETADETQGWDGTLGGEPQDMGTYFYYVKYKCADGKFYEQKGEVVLVR